MAEKKQDRAQELGEKLAERWTAKPGERGIDAMNRAAQKFGDKLGKRYTKNRGKERSSSR